MKDDEIRIAVGPLPFDVNQFFLEEEQVEVAVAEGRAKVLDVSDGTARDISPAYRLATLIPASLFP